MKYIIHTSSGPHSVKDFPGFVEAKKYAKTLDAKGYAEAYESSLYKMQRDGKLPKSKKFKLVD